METLLDTAAAASAINGTATEITPPAAASSKSARGQTPFAAALAHAEAADSLATSAGAKKSSAGTGAKEKGGAAAPESGKAAKPKKAPAGSTLGQPIHEKHPNRDKYRVFADALKFARGLKLKSSAEWDTMCTSGKRPADVPAQPERIYKGGGWRGYPHWLGIGPPTAAISNTADFLPFEEAHKVVLALNFKRNHEWKAWCKTRRPPNIPANPYQVYKNCGWLGYGQWLGSGRAPSQQKTMPPFEQAVAHVHVLKLKTQKQWREWQRDVMDPEDVYLPATPDRNYKDSGWQGWAHWLGCGHKYLSFADAHKFVQKHNLKSRKDWLNWCKNGSRPANIPASPDQVYKDQGWQGFGHWLGTGKIAPQLLNQQFLPFPDALKYARSLKLASQEAWRKWRGSGKRPSNIPSDPRNVYKDQGWQGLSHWLGTAKQDRPVAASGSSLTP